MNRWKSVLTGVVYAAGSLVAFVLLYDLLFSKPKLERGLVLEKLYVPGKSVTGDTPYGGMRRGHSFIRVQRDEQWIAVVLSGAQDTLTVHCHPEHYKIKEVGDTIHFKRYEGELFHIQYFAHNEETD
ncbi:MAG: hypothetical protein K2U26_16805 [Cyclobacteriaceae bacterium]|nr:hypothetical protein [Cyclobacteriaceae bacterium]